MISWARSFQIRHEIKFGNFKKSHPFDRQWNFCIIIIFCWNGWLKHFKKRFWDLKVRGFMDDFLLKYLFPVHRSSVAESWRPFPRSEAFGGRVSKTLYTVISCRFWFTTSRTNKQILSTSTIHYINGTGLNINLHLKINYMLNSWWSW